MRSNARCAVGLMDQSGTGDRAGIDHRVERPVVVGQPDRIERLAARLDADRRRNALLADHVERKRKHEGLGDRLDGERHRAVADLIDMAVDGDESDAEMRGVGALQFGNVIGDRAGMIRSEFLVTAVQKALERRLVGIAGISERRNCFWPDRLTWASTSSPCKWQEMKQSPCHGRLPALNLRIRPHAADVRHPDASRAISSICARIAPLSPGRGKPALPRRGALGHGQSE